MEEITNSPPMSMSKDGLLSSLRHLFTGAAAGAVTAVMVKVGPALEAGNVSVLTDYKTLGGVVIGAAVGGILRGLHYFFTNQTEIKKT